MAAVVRVTRQLNERVEPAPLHRRVTRPRAERQVEKRPGRRNAAREVGARSECKRQGKAFVDRETNQNVAPCAEALVRTLLKLHASRSINISTQIAADIAVRAQREDLGEILGNLLDNACKWARSRVALEASQAGATLILTIDDDGPGLAPDLRTVVLERGVRIDEAAPGSGLGLAIVRDLVEIYGGSIALDVSPLGGLRVRVLLQSPD